MPIRGHSYYSSLRPFRAAFDSGLPILTYHKLGPRPPRTRLKGLYVSARLFDRQLRELSQAGFHTASVSALAHARPRANRTVFLTFDDGFRNVLEHGLRPLAEHHFQALSYLVANLLGRENRWEIAEGEVPAPLMTTSEVRQWLAAGHEIGSHTLTHPWLTRLPVPRAREEISASRKKLEDRFGVPVRHFCYPYGDWNEAVRDLVIEAGYTTATTTQAGINQPDDSPFELKRLTARYPTRSFKAIWSRLRARLRVRLGAR